ncbi:MAG TPA: adenosine deaminase, partial [Hellea balneolensis]|nr:adenosine deaminase [Hellea balneolensis]
MKKLALILTVLLFAACTQPASHTSKPTNAASRLESIRDNEIELRAFLQDMPKGGNLHNHLFGAVYAEDWIRWAETDGLCLDEKGPAIRFPSKDGCGDLQTVKAALAGNQDLRNRLIDKLSVRDFVPAPGWSGHDQFFAT